MRLRCEAMEQNFRVCACGVNCRYRADLVELRAFIEPQRARHLRLPYKLLDGCERARGCTILSGT